METCSLLLLTLFSLLSEGLSFQCYVCSWSPEDKNNTTDICTDANFQPHRTVIDNSCEHGCEIFVQWDTNGALEQWRRNCFQKNHAPMTRECRKDSNIAWKRKICTCDADFCNSAISWAEMSTTTVVTCIAASVLMWRN